MILETYPGDVEMAKYESAAQNDTLQMVCSKQERRLLKSDPQATKPCGTDIAGQILHLGFTDPIIQKRHP